MKMKNVYIKVNDLDKLTSKKVVQAIKDLIEFFNFLDLRRFKQIIISNDVNTEVNKIKNTKHRKNASIYAKVITTIKNEQINILLILKKNYSQTLIKNSNDVLQYQNAIHIFHHELAHIHDFNKKIDIFEMQMLNDNYEGIQSITYPLAEVCWSEYIANFISSSTTTKNSFPLLTAQALVSLILSMNTEIKTKIQVYKSNKNRIDVFDDVKTDIEKTIKTAAYLLGYLDGLSITLAQLSDKIDYLIAKSTFKKTWDLMSRELSLMRSLYPYNWDNISIYNGLAVCFCNYYKEMGLVLKENDNKEIYFVVI
ncbi:MAG: hypothetical protein HRT43_01190 [Campylobacteraceae bacterium]|nr:hypothetical protein [Campylobacteraceae bacterium]